jgi:hypothetical protein
VVGSIKGTTSQELHGPAWGATRGLTPCWSELPSLHVALCPRHFQTCPSCMASSGALMWTSTHGSSWNSPAYQVGYGDNMWHLIHIILDLPLCRVEFRACHVAPCMCNLGSTPPCRQAPGLPCGTTAPSAQCRQCALLRHTTHALSRCHVSAERVHPHAGVCHINSDGWCCLSTHARPGTHYGPYWSTSTLQNVAKVTITMLRYVESWQGRHIEDTMIGQW